MSDFTTVDTEHGKVRGITKSSHLNSRLISFLGIPYATPPVGSLRFKVRFEAACETQTSSNDKIRRNVIVLKIAFSCSFVSFA